jgi:hypothetical protein
MKNIYLCGPVTGRPRQEAYGHFSTVEEFILGRAGAGNIQIRALNPMRFCPPEIDWVGAMKLCVRTLTRCHGIALLQGWQRSKGATLELKLAQDLQIPVVYIEPPVNSLDLDELFTASPEALRYYNARLTQFHLEGAGERIAEDRAVAELSNRYLDPYGFEHISISREE